MTYLRDSAQNLLSPPFGTHPTKLSRHSQNFTLVGRICPTTSHSQNKIVGGPCDLSHSITPPLRDNVTTPLNPHWVCRQNHFYANL